MYIVVLGRAKSHCTVPLVSLLDLKTVNQITGEIFIPYWVAHVTVLKLIQCLYTNTNKLYIVTMTAC